MLTKKVEEALNQQVQEEMYSAYLYLAMAAFACKENFFGFAHWMKIQSQEEWGHAMKIFDHILERDGKVRLAEIKRPPHDFKSIRNMIELALKQEQKVTEQIHQLYELAGKEKDYATQVMLQWFVKEQVEEEASVKAIVEKARMIPDQSSAILFLDKSLLKRGPEK